MWLLFCGMSIDAGIALGIFRHKLTINIKNVLINIKSEIMIYKKGEEKMFERKNENKVKKQFENVGG